jgi:hypothetical protein
MTNTKEEKQLLKIVVASAKLQELLHKSSYYQRDIDEDNWDPMLQGLINLNCGINETVTEYIAREKRLVGS